MIWDHVKRFTKFRSTLRMTRLTCRFQELYPASRGIANIGALVKGETYYVRVDAFNENGITEETVQKADKQ